MLRTAQFYGLILSGAAKAATLPAVSVPAGFRLQPVDVGEVSARLVRLMLGEPSDPVPDLGGPHVVTASGLIRATSRPPAGSARWPASRANRQLASRTDITTDK
jgi:hypothetical protein